MPVRRPFATIGTVPDVDVSLSASHVKSLVESRRSNTKLMTRLSVFVVAGALLAGYQTQQSTNTAVGTGAGAALGAIFGGGAVSSATTGRRSATRFPATRRVHGYAGDRAAGRFAQGEHSELDFVRHQYTNSYAIKPSFDPVLNPVTQTMQHPELIASVVGHTDNTDQPAYNQTLSQNRAQSVASHRDARRGGAAPVGLGHGPEPADRGQLDGSRPRAESPRGDLPARHRAAGSGSINYLISKEKTSPEKKLKLWKGGACPL